MQASQFAYRLYPSKIYLTSVNDLGVFAQTGLAPVAQAAHADNSDLTVRTIAVRSIP